jgi:hypothetical protein
MSLGTFSPMLNLPHPYKGVWARRCIFLRILNLNTRWRYQVQIWQLYSWGMAPSNNWMGYWHGRSVTTKDREATLHIYTLFLDTL